MTELSLVAVAVAIGSSQKCYPQLVACLRDAETDVLACYGFPVEHLRQI